jgi:hypothetical protein
VTEIAIEGAESPSVRDVFEDTAVTFKSIFRAGQWWEEGQVTYQFEASGGAEKLADLVVSESGGMTEQEVRFPKLTDTEDSYTLKFKVKASEGEFVAPVSYRVWPRKVLVTAVDGEGATVAGCPLRPVQGTLVDRTVVTLPNGVCVIQPLRPESIAFKAVSPWQIDSWQVDSGRNRKAVVSRMPYTAEIIEPVAREGAAEVIQWVNLPADESQLDAGSRLRIRVQAAGDAARSAEDKLALPGDPVHVRVTFARENTDRDMPRPALWVDENERDPTAGDAHIFEATVPLDQGGTATFHVELGQAGGDKCTVAVGATAACEDSSVVVVNWRRIHYRLQMPDCVPGNGGDFEDPTLEAVAGHLAPAFIELVCAAAPDVQVSDVPDVQIFDAAFFGETGGLRHVLPRRPRSHPHDFGVTENRTLCLRACHHLLQWDEAPKTVHLAVTSFEADGTIVFDLTSLGGWCLPINLDTGELGVSLVGCRWVALPTTEAHPGRTAVGGPPHAGSMASWTVEHESATSIRLRPPTFGGPGDWLGSETESTCPMELAFRLYIARSIPTYSANALVVLGGLGVDAKDTARLLSHELGHACGLTTPPGAAPLPPGVAPTPHVDAGGSYYRGPRSAGDRCGADGIRGGHDGSHCADGVSDKAVADFGDVAGTCLMFGDPSGADKYCDICLGVLKTRSLRDILSSWEGRASDFL